MSADGSTGRVGAVHGVSRSGLTVTRLHRSGLAPHRLLVLGGRTLLAPAGLPQAEALGERIADRVWLRTRQGVDLDMVWELRPALKAMLRNTSAWRLWRYDAVVVVADGTSGVVGRLRRRGLLALLRRAVRGIGLSSHVVVVPVDRARPARRAGAEPRTVRTDAWAAGGGDQVSVVSASSDAAAAAEAIAEQLMQPLASAAAAERRTPVAAVDEHARQQALDDLALSDRGMEQRLQQVVDLALDGFRTASAEITLIDRDRQWTLASAGLRNADSPRATSLCNRSIEQPSPTLIADTWKVPDLSGNPNVTGAGAIRFYAAHPIESIEGYRIGVLCVWDDVPHEVEDFDLSALRDLALLAEAEIISADRHRI